jgi:hypothetical protein
MWKQECMWPAAFGIAGNFIIIIIFLFFLLKINFFLYFGFDFKNNFLKIKNYYFNIYQHKKHFEKQLHSHFQTAPSNSLGKVISYHSHS